MPTLNDLASVNIYGRLYGAYDEEQYKIVGLDAPVGHTELLVYILDNLGGGGGSGINDITEGSGVPVAVAPVVGEPAVYQNTDNGNLYVWNGTTWVLLDSGSGINDITEGSGVPVAVAPVVGEPAVYQNTDNGDLYVWNSTAWVLLISGGDDDITEGNGAPIGAPVVNAPLVYQDLDNGNIYTWDSSQWNLSATLARNGLTKVTENIELGGTLIKATDVESDTFVLRMGRIAGNIIGYFSVRPTGHVDLFSRDSTSGDESGITNHSAGTTIEADDGTNLGQLAVEKNSIISSVGNGGTINNRVVINQDKLEIFTNKLELVTPLSVSPTAIGHVLTLIDSVTGESDFMPHVGGQSLHQYEASGVNGVVDNGAFVSVTVIGVAYERTGGSGQNTEGTLAVPASGIMRGVSVHFSSGQAPGNTFYLNIDYLNTGRPVNGTQDSVMPVLGTVASKPAAFTDGTPATNFVHSGTPLQIGIAQVDDNGTRTRVRYKITNYSQQVGSNASILSLIFP